MKESDIIAEKSLTGNMWRVKFGNTTWILNQEGMERKVSELKDKVKNEK